MTSEFQRHWELLAAQKKVFFVPKMLDYSKCFFGQYQKMLRHDILFFKFVFKQIKKFLFVKTFLFLVQLERKFYQSFLLNIALKLCSVRFRTQALKYSNLILQVNFLNHILRNIFGFRQVRMPLPLLILCRSLCVLLPINYESTGIKA